MSVIHTGKAIEFDVGKMVIVKNLGVDVLLGEPCKRDNEIVTIPHRSLVEVRNTEGKKIKLPYTSLIGNVEVEHCKAISSQTIYPGSIINTSVKNFSNEPVTLIPRPRYNWIKPGIYMVKENGSIDITNDKEEVFHISKHEHFADIVPCIKFDRDDLLQIQKVYDVDREDHSHLIPHINKEKDGKSYLKDIIIDPDVILDEQWKKKFRDVCQNFEELFTPIPGKYNGYYGSIDNSINFATTPPPSIRAHLPKYSSDKLKIMGEKMDTLESQ